MFSLVLTRDDAANLSRDTLLKLFRAHYLFNDTAHASFGLDADDRLCLFMRAPTSELAEELWVEMFKAFFMYLEWKEKLSSGATEDPLPGDELPDLAAQYFYESLTGVFVNTTGTGFKEIL